MELLLGCGNNRDRQLWEVEKGQAPWKGLVTLDSNVACKPDVVFDLEVIHYFGLPFGNETFEELHAYNVLEHVGLQGDWPRFFTEFEEYWRVLKPKGRFYIIVPSWKSEWAWGDPGHKRVLTPGTFSFLDKSNYKHLGATSMTDYQSVWKGNFKVLHQSTDDNHTYIILEKHAS